MIKKIGEITDILHTKESILYDILKKLDALKKLEEKIAFYLPEDIKPFCRLANFENGVLKFAVPNSLWGTRLRYKLPELLNNLRTQGGLPELASTHYYIETDFNTIFNIPD